ncbi:sugar ABC transporter substrate-binding protein [Alicyclobacillus kakegawensis]|uniref:sugar ABC transporter substrate-binding protein n=1 Tax=Alicyclobacillus kakegawensis TaxID=392012 RepID=UPI0009FB89CE|nr:sugar ABC transporter substrate-binding protein [Alicyclobacillus kakegawensis]
MRRLWRKAIASSFCAFGALTFTVGCSTSSTNSANASSGASGSSQLSSGSNAAQHTGNSKLTFYVIAHSGPSDPFWAVEQKGVQAAAKDLGVKAIFEGPQTFSIPDEVNLLNAAIAAKPAGIAVTLPDPKAFNESIKQAQANGIPVISFNAQDFSKSVPVKGYVGQDETQSGDFLASHVLNQLHSGDHTVILNSQPGALNLTWRERGIEQVLKPKGVSVDVLNIGTDANQAISILQSYFAKHPNVKLIFSLGPQETIPAVQFLKQANLQDKVKIASFDIDPNTLHAIQQGMDLGTVDQQPFVQAYMSVVELYLTAKYGMSPVDVNTGTLFVTKDNVSKMEKLVQSGIGG